MLKNIGKYSKSTLSSKDEYHFFDEIRPVLEKKFISKVEIIYEKDSNEQKASSALPGKPALVVF